MTRLLAIALLLSGALDPQQIFIRRAAAGGVDTPADFCSDLRFWFKPEDLSGGTNGNEISIWNDESSNLNDLTCATATENCPTYETSAWGSFTGAKGTTVARVMLFDSSFTRSGNLTFGWAVKTGAAGGPSVGKAAGSGNPQIAFADPADKFVVTLSGGATAYESQALSASTTYYVVMERISNSWDMYIDGVADTATKDNNDTVARDFSALFAGDTAKGGTVLEMWMCTDTGHLSAGSTYFADRY